MLEHSFHPIYAELPEQSLQCCVASIFSLCRDAAPVLTDRWIDELTDWTTNLHGTLTIADAPSNLLCEWTIGLHAPDDSTKAPTAAVFFRQAHHFSPLPNTPTTGFKRFLAITQV